MHNIYYTCILASLFPLCLSFMVRGNISFGSQYSITGYSIFIYLSLCYELILFPLSPVCFLFFFLSFVLFFFFLFFFGLCRCSILNFLYFPITGSNKNVNFMCFVGECVWVFVKTFNLALFLFFLFPIFGLLLCRFPFHICIDQFVIQTTWEIRNELKK